MWGEPLLPSRSLLGRMSVMEVSDSIFFQLSPPKKDRQAGEVLRVPQPQPDILMKVFRLPRRPKSTSALPVLEKRQKAKVKDVYFSLFCSESEC